MSRRAILIVTLLVVAAGVAAWWVFSAGADDRETAVAERGSIDVTIETVGTIQATDAVALRSRAAGTIAQIGAENGDLVHEGDIIVFLDPTPFDKRVQQAEQQLEQAEYALQLAETKLDDDPENPSLRLEALAAAQRVRDAGELVDDAREARANVALLAPRAGTVTEMTVAAGDVIAEHQQIARIVGEDDLTLVADVDELDLPNVQPGATVRFRLDAFPATELTGVVESTAPQARAQGGATVFPTVIRFDRPEELDIRAGMNADVTIVTEARENVLLIPERALRTVGDRAFVTVVSGSDTEEREVRLGYRGQGFVEIVEGLDDAEVVALQ